MGIYSPFGGRVGSGGGIVLFELLDGHITQEFVNVGRKKDGARRPSGGGSTRRRGRGRLPRGNGGDIRRPIDGSVVPPDELAVITVTAENTGEALKEKRKS